MLMVIGLLQTAGYMRCVFGIPDSPEPSPGEVDDAVAAREARQQSLDSPSRHFVFIMTEGALRWHTGSPAIMADQARAIAEAWTTPATRFPRGGFHLYHDAAVHVANAIITAPADVGTYTDIFAALEESASFGDKARADLGRIAADYELLSAG